MADRGYEQIFMPWEAPERNGRQQKLNDKDLQRRVPMRSVVLHHKVNIGLQFYEATTLKIRKNIFIKSFKNH